MRTYQVLQPFKCNGRTVRGGAVELSDNAGLALMEAGLVARPVGEDETETVSVPRAETVSVSVPKVAPASTRKAKAAK